MSSLASFDRSPNQNAEKSCTCHADELEEGIVEDAFLFLLKPEAAVVGVVSRLVW